MAAARAVAGPAVAADPHAYCQEYCQNVAAASGSSFYYAFRFLPPDRRRAITAFYAFCREVDDIADECRDPQVARTKLAWWRGEIIQLYAGQPSHPVTQPPRHPVNQCHASAGALSLATITAFILIVRSRECHKSVH